MEIVTLELRRCLVRVVIGMITLFSRSDFTGAQTDLDIYGHDGSTRRPAVPWAARNTQVVAAPGACAPQPPSARVIVRSPIHQQPSAERQPRDDIALWEDIASTLT